MKSPKGHFRSAFTLIELLVVIAIIAILAAILFPVFAQAREKARQSTCLSNQKQVALGMLQYVQDYDELFPSAFGLALVGNPPVAYPQHWAVDQIGGVNAPISVIPAGVIVPGLIQPYIKNNQVLTCPSNRLGASNTSAGVAYMYNDLMAGRSIAAMNGPAQTVVVSESTTATSNLGVIGPNQLQFGIGHSINPPLADTPGAYPQALPVPPGTAGLFTANTVPPSPVVYQTESADLDDVSRHSNGGNFAFGDGHVKWFRLNWNAVNGHTTNIYFPPAGLVQQNARIGGATFQVGNCLPNSEPVPGGNMCNFGGTFHLN